jgi:hypothetical protein
MALNSLGRLAYLLATATFVRGLSLVALGKGARLRTSDPRMFSPILSEGI